MHTKQSSHSIEQKQRIFWTDYDEQGENKFWKKKIQK